MLAILAPLTLASLALPPAGEPQDPVLSIVPYNTLSFLLQDGYLILRLFEAGSDDINGDGDMNDLVLQVKSPGGQTFTMELGGGSHRLGGDQLYFLLSESVEDLNGDGDLSDGVLQRLDLTTGTLSNSGLAAETQFVDYKAGELGAIFIVREDDQGDTDLNGDGDATDTVLHIWPAGSSPLNLGVANGALSEFELDGPYVHTGVSEVLQGLQDLNGDGDFFDWDVLHVGIGPSVANLGVSASGEPVFLADWLLYRVYEAAEGEDLNGDGDELDLVLRASHAGTQLTVTLHQSMYLPEKTANHLVFLAGESLFGLDLNADGDLLDEFVHSIHLTTGALGVSPLPVNSYEATDRGLILRVEEEFAGEDVNGDGDLLDEVRLGYSYETGELTLLPDYEYIELGPQDALLVVSEEASSSDLNGDGDSVDHVLHHYGFATGAVHNSGLALYLENKFDDQVEAGDKHGAFLVYEPDQGGVDLNGDGLTGGRVLHTYSYDTGKVVNFAVPMADLKDVQMDGDRLGFQAQEIHLGGDVNGDGVVAGFVQVLTEL